MPNDDGHCDSHLRRTFARRHVSATSLGRKVQGDQCEAVYLYSSDSNRNTLTVNSYITNQIPLLPHAQSKPASTDRQAAPLCRASAANPKDHNGNVVGRLCGTHQTISARVARPARTKPELKSLTRCLVPQVSILFPFLQELRLKRRCIYERGIT